VGLSFRGQLKHAGVPVPLDSSPDSRLPQPGGPGPQEQLCLYLNIVYKNSVRTSQATLYKTKELTLFKETIAVYCENNMEHTNTLCGQNAEFCNIYKLSPYLTGNRLRLRYKAQPVNAV
jgi:hypothetical protein